MIVAQPSSSTCSPQPSDSCPAEKRSFVFNSLRTLNVSCSSFSHFNRLFSIACALFDKNTGGGIPLQDFVSCARAQKCLSVSPFPATLTHSLSRNSFPCHSCANTRDGGAPLPKFFSPLANRHSPLQFLNTFRINTCKSESKQRTSSPFRINTYEKLGGGAVGSGFRNVNTNTPRVGGIPLLHS
jgi:hypothetical protein